MDFSFSQRKQTFNWLIGVSIASLLLAVTVEGFFYFPPYFDLLYWYEPLVNLILDRSGLNESQTIETINSSVAQVVSIGSLICLMLYLVWPKRYRGKWILISWIFLVLYYLAEWVTHGQTLGFAMEVSLQLFLFPTVVVFRNRPKQMAPILLILCTLTFFGHGLFALDIYPRPGYFVDMVVEAFGLSNQNALLFLRIVGIADLACILLVFLPATQTITLFYMLFWGFLTALARPVYNFSEVFLAESILIWVPEFFQRVAHFCVPAALLIVKRELPLIKV